MFICNFNLYYQKLNNIKYYIIFRAIHFEILFFILCTPGTVQNCESRWFWAAANIQLHAGDICDRKLQTPHSSVTLAEATKIQLYKHGHWMYTYFNFSGFGDESHWSMKCIVSCHGPYRGHATSWYA